MVDKQLDERNPFSQPASQEEPREKPGFFGRITSGGRRVKLPLIMVFMSVALLIVALFSASILIERNASFNALIEERGARLDREFNSRIASEADALTLAIRGILGIAELQAPYQARDRDGLMAIAGPLYEVLNEQHGITHFYFTDLERVNFLRVHAPERYGDTISRVTMLRAQGGQEISSGMEMGVLGTFTLRVVAPWEVNGELIGYMEIGKEINHLVSAIEEIGNSSITELISKSVLDETAWRDRAVALGQPDDWHMLEDYVLVESGEVSYTHPELLRLAQTSDIDGTAKYWSGGQFFAATAFDLRDILDERVGKMIAVWDMTNEQTALRDQLVLDIGVAGVVVLISLYLVNRLLGAVQFQVSSAHSSLEKGIEERSNALAETSRRLLEESRIRAQAEGKRQFFSRILEDSLNEIYIFDAEDYHFIHVNHGALENMGYSLEEMENKSAHGIKPDFTLEAFRQAVAPLVTGEKKFLVFEARHKRKNGTLYPVEVRLQFFKNENPPVFVAVINDITKRKRAERRIMQLNESLEERVEQRTRELKEARDTLVETEKMASLGNLVAGVAHEINTPVGIGVTAITHLAERLETLNEAYKNGALTQEDLESFLDSSKEATQIVEQNLSRASELIRSFKMVAVDRNMEEMRSIDLRPYIDDVLLSLKPQLKQKKHKIHFECADDLQIVTYPGGVGQIITNLVTNAVTHAFEDTKGGEMWLRVVDDSHGRIRLVFRDNGKGINPDFKERIFDPFVTSNRAGGGTGLGLHIVHNLVTQTLQGTIQVHSEEGKGTTFEICIPRDAKDDDNSNIVKLAM